MIQVISHAGSVSLPADNSSEEKVLRELAAITDSVTNPSGVLRIPPAMYAALQIDKGKLSIAETDGEKVVTYERTIQQQKVEEEIISWLEDIFCKRGRKCVALELRVKNGEKMISPLWLQEDVFTYATAEEGEANTAALEDLAREVASRFDEDNAMHIALSRENEVEVSELVTLEDYRKTVSQEEFSLLTYLANEFKGKKLVFINATPRGAGAASMRHALIRLLRLLDVDAHWYILVPRKEAFDITKQKFHNVLQAIANPENTKLTATDKEVYNAWMKENAEGFEQAFQQANVIVVDDPPPSGLVPYIKHANPHAKIIYRSHIQIIADRADQPGTPQHTTWSFIWNHIKDADCFVSQPKREFIPGDVPAEKIVYMPATTDPLDGLNKPLTEAQMAYYLQVFDALLQEAGQQALDANRPYIIQIARFDPSKGILDVIKSYRQLREMLEREKKVIPQLVIAGNGSIDDPDGIPVYNGTMALLNSEAYAYLANDVKVVSLPPIEQLSNTLLRKSAVVLQLSIREGFEVKVTEALMKGKPVIAYNTGGIPLQIEDGITGYLVKVGEINQVAKHLYDLLTDNGRYQHMSQAAAQRARKDCLTIPNAICWLFLATQLLKGDNIEGHYQWVKVLAERYFRK